jgi:AraC-like DNA-binding protein
MTDVDRFSALLRFTLEGSHPVTAASRLRLPDSIRRDLTVDNLARRAAMSPRNFARLFQQQMGKTAAGHIEDLRLEAARRQLESTTLGLEESRVPTIRQCGDAPPRVQAPAGIYTWPIQSVFRRRRVREL